MKQQLVIGVSGGSGSGKTHFSKQLVKMYEEDEVVLICADYYFKKELPKMISPLTQKEYDDWNSPESLNYEALLADVKKAIEKSVKVVIIEGVYIFSYDELRKMMQLKIFIDTNVELRLYRRIKRNMEIFNMEMEEIAAYFIESAKFQEDIYSIPTKIYADIIFNGAKEFTMPLQIVNTYIKSLS